MRLKLRVPAARGGGAILQLPSSGPSSFSSFSVSASRYGALFARSLSASSNSRYTALQSSTSRPQPSAYVSPHTTSLRILSPAPLRSTPAQTRSSSTFWKLYNAMSGGEPPSTPKEVRKYLQQSHERVFENNRKWASEQKAKHPEFFEKLTQGQSPDYLYIGCSDSRIPAEAITGLEPGEMFIHRNIANLVCNTDLNVMSVVSYAVRHLHVKHIVVCGHYGCGGVKAAMTPKDMGILNPWLRNIRDVYRLHEAELDGICGDSDLKYDRLVELNVMEQARNVIKTAAVQQSFAERGYPIVHGWVFGFGDGLLKDLQIDFEGELERIKKIFDLTPKDE